MVAIRQPWQVKRIKSAKVEQIALKHETVSAGGGEGIQEKKRLWWQKKTIQSYIFFDTGSHLSRLLQRAILNRIYNQNMPSIGSGPPGWHNFPQKGRSSWSKMDFLATGFWAAVIFSLKVKISTEETVAHAARPMYYWTAFSQTWFCTLNVCSTTL